jgi:hypothetical protein
MLKGYSDVHVIGELLMSQILSQYLRSRERLGSLDQLCTAKASMFEKRSRIPTRLFELFEPFSHQYC